MHILVTSSWLGGHTASEWCRIGSVWRSNAAVFVFQQSLVSAHPMAPPSPSTTSSNNNSSSSSSSGWDQLSKTNLYIRGLPPNTTDQDLVKLCQP